MASTPPLTFHKVLAMPAQPVADGVYFVKDGSEFDLVAVDENGVAVPLALHRSPLELAFGSAGRPPAAAEFGRYRVVNTVDWAASLSTAVSEIAATAQSDVLVKRGLDTVARFRWAAGSNQGIVSIIIPTVDPGDILIITAPIQQDATLAGIAGSLAGLRRT